MPDHFYVYPAYLRRGLPRSMGRRVPSAQGIPDVTVEAIAAAAKALGFHAETEAEKRYPRDSLEGGGRVKVRKKAGVTKASFLKRLSDELQRQPPPAGKA